MDIIDSHCHVLSEDTAAYPLAPLGGKQSVWAAERPVTADGLLARMDTVGIARAVLVQATTAYGYDNSYVVDSARRHPDRFAAVGTVDPLAEGAADGLRSATDKGLAGVRLFTNGSTVSEQGLWFAEAATDPFWAAAAETGIPVCLQLKLGEDTTPVLVDLLERHPRAVILLDHCGYPDVSGDLATAAEPLVALATNPGLHLKLTHRTLEGLDAAGASAGEFLNPVVSAFGSDRIAWGSNCPAAAQPLDELFALAGRVLSVVSEDARQDILGNTARRLYPTLAPS